MNTDNDKLPTSLDAIADERRDLEKAFRERSAVYDAQVRMMADLYGDGDGKARALDQRTRILIALGMAVHAGAPSSVEWAVTRALNHGATLNDIIETVDLALLNGGTFAVSNGRLALKVADLRSLRPRKS